MLLDGQVDGLGLAHPLGPVAFAGEAGGQRGSTCRKNHAAAGDRSRTDLHARESRSRPERRSRRACSENWPACAPEQRHAQQREQDLRERLQCRADRDGRGGIAHGHAPLRQVARHEHRAADLPGGQEAVGRLPGPARQHRIPQRMRRRPGARTTPGSPRHRAPAAPDETRRPAAAPSPPRASVDSTAGKPCEASTPMNSNTPADRSQVAARVMSARCVPRRRRRIPGGSRSRPTASFMLEIRRHHGCMCGSVTYSNVSETRRLVLAQRRDAVAQLVAVEEHQPAGRNLHRAGNDRRARFARVQLVVEPAGGFVDHAEEQRVAPAGVVRGVVVPADVIARPGVEVQRVGVRVIGRRDLQRLAGELLSASR